MTDTTRAVDAAAVLAAQSGVPADLIVTDAAYARAAVDIARDMRRLTADERAQTEHAADVLAAYHRTTTPTEDA